MAGYVGEWASYVACGVDMAHARTMAAGPHLEAEHLLQFSVAFEACAQLLARDIAALVTCGEGRRQQNNAMGRRDTRGDGRRREEMGGDGRRREETGGDERRREMGGDGRRREEMRVSLSSRS